VYERERERERETERDRERETERDRGRNTERIGSSPFFPAFSTGQEHPQEL
jgi:hypothetical protein